MADLILYLILHHDWNWRFVDSSEVVDHQRFQERYVEYTGNTKRRRQFRCDSHWVDYFQDLEWPNKMRS